MNDAIECVVLTKVGDICFYGVDVSEDYALKMDKKRLSVFTDAGALKTGEALKVDLDTIITQEKKVVKRDNAWCVVRHDTGEPIKCYSIDQYGDAGARKRAYALLSAIEHGGEGK